MENGIDVPQDLWIPILKELPVKSLLRFRCVSKLWLSIIDDPCFIDLHHDRSYSRPGGLHLLIQSHFDEQDETKFFTFRPEQSPTLRLDFSYPASNLSLEPSSGAEGLVCVKYHILNPSTRKRIVLPPSEPGFMKIQRGGPWFWQVPRYFLGFNSSSNEYKVLSLRCVEAVRSLPTESWTIYSAKVLTLGTNSWRNIDLGPHNRFPWFYSFYASCCIDNVLYVCQNATCSVAAFDLETEIFRLITMPFVDSWPEYFTSLHDVGGNLILFDFEQQLIWKLEGKTSMTWKWERIVPPKWDANSPNWSSHDPYYFLYDLKSVPGLKEILPPRSEVWYTCSKQVETLRIF